MVQVLVGTARWAAVEKLQRRGFFRDPCSFGSAVADHAVGLVLSLNRSVDSYLAHNACRDARKVVAARSRLSCAPDVSFIETERMMLSHFSSDFTATYEGLVSHSEPAILWQDAFARLRMAVAHRDCFAAARSRSLA